MSAPDPTQPPQDRSRRAIWITIVITLALLVAVGLPVAAIWLSNSSQDNPNPAAAENTVPATSIVVKSASKPPASTTTTATSSTTTETTTTTTTTTAAVTTTTTTVATPATLSGNTSYVFNLTDACKWVFPSATGWGTKFPMIPADRAYRVFCTGGPSHEMPEDIDVQRYCDTHDGGTAVAQGADWYCNNARIAMDELCRSIWGASNGVKLAPGGDVYSYRCMAPVIGDFSGQQATLNGFCASLIERGIIASNWTQARPRDLTQQQSWVCTAP